MKYHPALMIAFMLEDAGHEIDWDSVYEAIDEAPNYVVEKWRKEYREGRVPLDRQIKPRQI